MNYLVTFQVSGLQKINVLDHRFCSSYTSGTGKMFTVFNFPDLKDLNRFLQMTNPDYIIVGMDTVEDSNNKVLMSILVKHLCAVRSVVDWYHDRMYSFKDGKKIPNNPHFQVRDRLEVVYNRLWSDLLSAGFNPREGGAPDA